MTVQNPIVKNVYEGNGNTTVFPYTFDILATDGEHVAVYVTNDSDVSEATDNFTIDTTAKAVTYPKTGDPLPAGKKITILREIPNAQELNLENLGPFFAEDIESTFDRVVMMIQQLAEKVDRSVKIDVSSPFSPDEILNTIFNKAAEAAASAANAKDSEDAAADSESAAAASEARIDEMVANATLIELDANGDITPKAEE